MDANHDGAKVTELRELLKFLLYKNGDFIEVNLEQWMDAPAEERFIEGGNEWHNSTLTILSRS